MVLVDYSDSDDDGQNKKPASQPSLKRKLDISESLPPLPAAFHNLYTTAARGSTTDDPTLHGGRKRQVPHAQGNWATHLYLEWHPSEAESQRLSQVLDRLQQNSSSLLDRSSTSHSTQIHPLYLTSLSTPAPLHISLSSPLILKSHECDAFRIDMEAALNRARVRPFSTGIASIKLVSNEDASRWFVVAEVSRPFNNELNRLLFASNLTAHSWGKPRLYEDNRQSDVFAGRLFRRTESGGEQRRCHGAEPGDNFHENPADDARLSLSTAKPSAGDDVQVRGQKGLEHGLDPANNHNDHNALSSQGCVPDRDNCFHLSLGWCLDLPEALHTLMNDHRFMESALSLLAEFEINFQDVKLKIGNQLHVLPFRERHDRAKRILG